MNGSSIQQIYVVLHQNVDGYQLVDVVSFLFVHSQLDEGGVKQIHVFGVCKYTKKEMVFDRQLAVYRLLGLEILY